MHRSGIFLFLLLSAAFATTHIFAVELSLYWYYWWFDIFMHLWGGLLLGSGVHVLSPLSLIPIRPTTGVVLLVLLGVTVTWEVFEWFAGLYNPVGYVWNTGKDIVMGFAGGLLAHAYWRRGYNRQI